MESDANAIQIKSYEEGTTLTLGANSSIPSEDQRNLVQMLMSQHRDSYSSNSYKALQAQNPPVIEVDNRKRRPSSITGSDGNDPLLGM